MQTKAARMCRDLQSLAILWESGRYVFRVARACAAVMVAAVVGATVPIIANAQGTGAGPLDPTAGGGGTAASVYGGIIAALVSALIAVSAALAKKSGSGDTPERPPAPAPKVEIDFPDPSWSEPEKATAFEVLRRNERRLEDLHKWLDPEGGRIQDNVRDIHNAVVKTGAGE